MLKSVRYRNDAKLILGIGLVLCALGCAAYGVLLIPAVKGIKFQWEYLAIAVGVMVIFALISLYMLCLSRSWAKREKKREALQADENLGLAVEDLSVEALYGENAVMIEAPASVTCTGAVSNGSLPQIKVDTNTVKKVAKVVLPIVGAAIVGAAIASNAKNAKQAKRRKQFYRWLG